MAIIKEFKEFALRGNVVDMAVGIIIGAAFSKIVTSVIDDLIMPLVGKAVGNVDFSNLYVPLADKVPAGLALAEAKKLGPVFAWGNFVTTLINFIILAFCIFMVIKAMNNMKNRMERTVVAAGPTTKECPQCASMIPIKAKKCPLCTSVIA
jgi:large conductance mechanosensitive channel